MNFYPVATDAEAYDLPIEESGVTGVIRMNAPVQCSGTIKGKPFYFCARGDRWTLAISEPNSDPVDPSAAIFWRDGEYGTGFDASWMAKLVAKLIILDCARDFSGQNL